MFYSLQGSTDSPPAARSVRNPKPDPLKMFTLEKCARVPTLCTGMLLHDTKFFVQKLTKNDRNWFQTNHFYENYAC